MELYQALLDVAASMALVPDLVPALVRPHTPGAKSIVKELLPRFRDTMSAYPTALRGQIGSPDFQLIDFIGRIETYADVLLTAAHRYERDLPVEQRVKTATTRRRKSAHDDRALMQLSSSPPTTSRLGTASSTTVQSASTSSADLNRLYTASLKHLQIQTCRFIGDYGKLVVPYTFTKEVRNLNPFSPALKDRTKRIAKVSPNCILCVPIQPTKFFPTTMFFYYSTGQVHMTSRINNLSCTGISIDAEYAAAEREQ